LRSSDTYVQSSSLGGNARTTLIVNCSPNSYNALETLSTLRFGFRLPSPAQCRVFGRSCLIHSHTARFSLSLSVLRASKIKNKPVMNQHRSVEVLEALLKVSEHKNEEQVQNEETWPLS
jgi:hypothetical protein